MFNTKEHEIYYKVFIDNNLKEPKIFYIKRYEFLRKNKNKEVIKKINLPITEVEIYMNEDMYKKLMNK